jgi:glycerophosphoryl diester phosphodiesterase
MVLKELLIMSLFKNRFIAHRGFHEGKYIPENSLLSFEKAKERNYAIEFDLTITKDNQIIVFHDDNLFRLCNVNKNVEEQYYSFIKELNLYDTNEHIPLFKDVLALVNGDIPLVIEIKKHNKLGVLESILVELLEEYKGVYFICSFEKDILFWFRKNKASFKRGLIFGYNTRKFNKYKYLLFLYKYFKTKPDFVSLEESLIRSSIYFFCKKNSINILTWTIRNKKRFDEIEDIVDGIIFEGFLI